MAFLLEQRIVSSYFAHEFGVLVSLFILMDFINLSQSLSLNGYYRYTL